jgi:hypothetical protein
VVNKLKRAENSLLQPTFLYFVRRAVLQQQEQEEEEEEQEEEQEQAVFAFILDASTKHVLLINNCLKN